MCIYHRPHFEQLAVILAECRAHDAPDWHTAAHDYIVQAFADALAAENPAFRRNAFLRNAGAEHLVDGGANPVD